MVMGYCKIEIPQITSIDKAIEWVQNNTQLIDNMEITITKKRNGTLFDTILIGISIVSWVMPLLLVYFPNMFQWEYNVLVVVWIVPQIIILISHLATRKEKMSMEYLFWAILEYKNHNNNDKQKASNDNQAINVIEGKYVLHIHKT